VFASAKINLGIVSGEKKLAHFELLNLAARPLVVTGSQTSCSCSPVITHLPLTVEAGKSANIDVEVAPAAATAGDVDFETNVILYTNSAVDPTIVGTVFYSARRSTGSS
jgi:hypothetical protein